MVAPMQDVYEKEGDGESKNENPESVQTVPLPERAYILVCTIYACMRIVNVLSHGLKST